MPAIRISAACHLCGVAAIAIEPPLWPYIATALAGNHVAFGLAGMWPRSAIIGANLRRLPAESAARDEIALTFDDGPDPVATLQVLDLLDQFRAKASFFCIGEKARKFPELVREIARRGHSVENHSHHHPGGFAVYGIRRLHREMEMAQETLRALSGRAPEFFRAPIGLRNPLLDPVLARLGLTYVSWTRRGFDGVDRRPRPVLTRLLRQLDAGDILLLHDRMARDGSCVAVSVLPALLEAIAARGLRPVALPAAMRGPVQ